MLSRYRASDSDSIPKNGIFKDLDVILESNVFARCAQVNCVRKAQHDAADGWIDVEERESNQGGQ